MNSREHERSGAGANARAKGWILFWLLGYPIGVAAYIALLHLASFQ
jgi:hypothetical protein